MFDIINRTVSSYNMLSGKKLVVVGVSGGADSMCLLHFLVSNSDFYGIKVIAAHINHCLRGEESDRDCAFVVEQCKKLGVQCFVKKADVAQISSREKIGTEECGRKIRYDFFDEIIDKFNDQFIYKYSAIATAHTASDNAETVLLNITRGCGIDGLCGIPAVRGNIIRPLINITRQQVEQYCLMNSVPYVTDSTNLTDDYSRNKVRLTVLPELSKINPDVVGAVNRMSSIVSRNVSYIKDSVRYEYDRCSDGKMLDLKKLSTVSKDLLPEIIKYAVSKNLGITAEKKHIDLIEKVIEQGHGAVCPRKNIEIKITDGHLVFYESSNCSSDTNIRFTAQPIKTGKTYCFNGKTYSVSDKKSETPFLCNKINKKLLNQLISYDIISCGAVLRNRQSGDFFRPFGRNCTKSLKKLFTEMKIPQSERSTRMLLADGSKILWIEGIGVSQEAAVSINTKFYFTIEVNSENG